MDLPIFHGRHSSNTQIQTERVYYWAVWHSMTPIWEQHLKRRKKELDLAVKRRREAIYWARCQKVCTLASAMLSCQNKASQQCCTVCEKNKSATRADNNTGLNRHVENPSSTNKTLNSLIVPEGHVAHEGTAVAREAQNNTKFSCKRLGRLCKNCHFLSCIAQGSLAAAVLLND